MSHAQRLYIDIEEYETNARGGKMGNTVASMNDVEVTVCNGSDYMGSDNAPVEVHIATPARDPDEPRQYEAEVMIGLTEQQALSLSMSLAEACKEKP